MRVADGVEMLSLDSQIANGPGITHPVIIHDENDVILIDTGLPGQFPQLSDEFQKAGIPFERLCRIIITHSDIDHIGGLASIQNELPKKAEVLSTIEEKPYIECEKPPIRLAKIGESLNFLKGEQYTMMKGLYDNLSANYKNLKADVDRIVEDGEELPNLGGIKIIFTPGHTPGHICIYLEKYKLLIAGDALSVEKEELVPSQELLTLDKVAASSSLKKLSQLDIDTVICYHGGVCKKDVNSRMAELAGV